MTDIYAYMEKKLGVKIEPFIATDYSGVVEAMRAGHLDVAWYGPFSYVLAAQEAGAEAFVLPVGKNTGKTYHSYFITRVDTGINTVLDIKGRTFTFGDPASTSGHLIPRYNLIKAGVDPDKDLKSVTFSGAHDATGLAVANGKVEAGAIWDGAYLRLIEKKMIDESKIKLIQKSDPIPEGPWAFRKDLPADLKQKMTQALLEIGTEAPEALKNTTYVKFEAVADGDYNVIRETAKALHLDVKKLK
jgi:phosphonate transport system substrate-binding protein